MRKTHIVTATFILGLFTAASAFGAEAVGNNANNRNIPTPKTLTQKLASYSVNAKEYGVIGDGVFNNTTVLQTALDAAKTKGPICYFPSGHYRLNGSLVVPPGVTLCGASGGVPHSEHPIGTVLLTYGDKGKADGEPLITLKPNAVIRNLVIHYPEQTLPGVLPYPWTIRGEVKCARFWILQKQIPTRL